MGEREATGYEPLELDDTVHRNPYPEMPQKLWGYNPVQDDRSDFTKPEVLNWRAGYEGRDRGEPDLWGKLLQNDFQNTLCGIEMLDGRADYEGGDRGEPDAGRGRVCVRKSIPAQIR